MHVLLEPPDFGKLLLILYSEAFIIASDAFHLPILLCVYLSYCLNIHINCACNACFARFVSLSWKRTTWIKFFHNDYQICNSQIQPLFFKSPINYRGHFKFKNLWVYLAAQKSLTWHDWCTTQSQAMGRLWGSLLFSSYLFKTMSNTSLRAEVCLQVLKRTNMV